MPDWIARRCLVSGRVQGVWYRAATRERAVALGVTGHALNLADGRVEVLACGDPAAVEAAARRGMEDALRRYDRTTLPGRVKQISAKPRNAN